jgi:hypothetical protein
VYLRALSDPIRVANGLHAGELFPLLNAAQAAPVLKIIKIEFLREASTMVMLAAAAALAARGFPGWLSAFAVVFGVWDLSFYGSLRALIGWPASLFDWDLLFLLPVPWSGPVVAPMIIAASMVVFGSMSLLREPRVSRLHWIMMSAGGAIVYASFIWDWRGIALGGMPEGFPWAMFWVGEIVSVAAFLHAARRSRVLSSTAPGERRSPGPQSSSA